MKDNNIGPENIFFTDESVFPLYAYLNKGTNKIRLSKKTIRKLKAGDEKSTNLVTREHSKLLKYYKEDLNKFPSKSFKQDGARSHSNYSSMMVPEATAINYCEIGSSICLKIYLFLLWKTLLKLMKKSSKDIALIH